MQPETKRRKNNMQKNLVIVESPAKAKTIGSFLGEDYKVMSSYGHIRDLKKKDFSIDTQTFTPVYEIPTEKQKLVSDLKSQAKEADIVWLASDEDREGEAISWHLYEVLGLQPERSRRIVFHEITKPAILAAIENPRSIDINLVNAQQARRVLDRIVGFKLSPVLWRKIKPALSAGRVQSVAVRLLVEREREIRNFNSEVNYRVTAIFDVPGGNGEKTALKAELNHRFKTAEEARAFLEGCQNATFTIGSVSTKPLKRTPAPPFTTSTLQQEAARKLGFSVSQTMSVAQRLYESGLITYMRTDSVNLSNVCINACKPVIKEMMGEEYSKVRRYHTNTKGAQEAHEAIRPTDMSRTEIKGTSAEVSLYQLIWKRTLACQMADAQIEKTTVAIQISGQKEQFIATGEVVKFDGFIRVYRESFDDEQQESESGLLPELTQGMTLNREEINAIERFTQHPPRYTEASLVHKLEELGIGRPSTYAPTISTIQQRQYVVKGDKEGEERQYHVISLKGNKVTTETQTETIGSEKGKLIPTNIGIVVNDFLLKNFANILDYNFTAKVEKDFDEVAEGKEDWTKLMRQFYAEFEPEVEKTMAEKSEHKVGERELGIDPISKRPVFVKIGRFGPVAQKGKAGDKEKPQFAPLKKGQNMEDITLEEALDLFKLPRLIGEFEGSPMEANIGRFGPYIRHDGKYISLPKEYDPMTITEEESIELIQSKREAEQQRHIKTFDEEPNMEILNGRFGPYIAYNGKNFHLSKTLAARAAELTLEECRNVIRDQEEKSKTPHKRRRAASTAKTTTTRKK